MQKFDNVDCIIMTRPIVEMESPFYLTFDVQVKGDIIGATFIGNFARALVNNIEPGDTATIRNGLVVDGALVFDFMHLDVSTAVGRNVDTHV